VTLTAYTGLRERLAPTTLSGFSYESHGAMSEHGALLSNGRPPPALGKAILQPALTSYPIPSWRWCMWFKSSEIDRELRKRLRYKRMRGSRWGWRCFEV